MATPAIRPAAAGPAHRPPGAPKGQIRAQMATFPGREAMLRDVIAAIGPQVDRLVILFNQMDAAPADLEADPRIEAITTDVDVKDLGRFFLPPAADDIVFLIDDDLDYPADYVARSIAAATEIGWDGNVFGYQGFNHRHEPGAEQIGWRQLRMSGAVRRAQGVRMLGTGTVVARGDTIPPIESMAPYLGHADVGFALYQWRAGRLCWALPRAAGWIGQDQSDRIAADSPLVALRDEPPLPVVAALHELIGAPMPHLDLTPQQLAKRAGRRGAKATGA